MRKDKILRIGKVTYDGKFINIDGPYAYDFTIERFKTVNDLLGWLYHMQEKNWFTNSMGRDLIDIYGAIRGDLPKDFREV